MMNDIFSLIKKIDSCDKKYYNDLPEEDKKKIYLFLIQRWLTGTDDKKQILFVNHFSNDKIFRLYNHPDLVYKLLCCSSTGIKRYKWIGRKKNKKGKSELLQFIKEHYDCSDDDALEFSAILSNDAISEMMDHAGLDKETVKKIKKEMK